MQELNRTDMHYILSRVPRDIRDLMMKQRLFLAGGFIRGTIAGEPVSDIDLLGPDKDMLRVCSLELATGRKGRIHETDNALTVIAPPRTPVQFITRWLYDNPESLIGEFDFTIVQAAIWWEPNVDPLGAEIGLGKWRSVCSDGFYPDLAARRLVYTAPHRHEDAGGSILRVIKYIKRGYSIQVPSLASVVARLVSAIDTRHSDALVARAFVNTRGQEENGETGVFLTEEYSTPILIGLLREVDPLSIIDGIEPAEEDR